MHAETTWAAYVTALGQNMHRARVAQSRSQEDIAYRAGLSRYTYQRFEHGVSRPGTSANPSLRAVLAIAQALDVPVSALLPAEIPDLSAGSDHSIEAGKPPVDR